MSLLKCQTFQERLNDKTKIDLAPQFVETLVLTAQASKRTVDDLWVMWRTYSESCHTHDQSAIFPEFCSWNKLTGRGPLA